MSRQGRFAESIGTFALLFMIGGAIIMSRSANGQNAREPNISTMPATNGTKGGGTAPAATKPNTGTSSGDTEPREVPALDSVGSQALQPMKDREIRVQGIIGDYHQTTNRYEFHMNDGSHIEVVGTYPSVAHTTYTLNARVLREGSRFVLSEIHKERSGVGGDWNSGVDPLVLAGGLILVAAVVTFAAMTARGNTARKQAVEHQIEQERRRAENAHQQVARLRAGDHFNRASEPAGRGQTIVTPTPGTPAQNGLGARAGGVPPPPARTIVSIGSIEVITGPHQGQKFPLQHGETRLGRAATNDIALDRDGEVSSQHGSLIVTIDGRMLYRDESTNGSLLNGNMVHHRQIEALSGSALEIGASTLRLTLRALKSAPPLPLSQPLVVTPEPSALEPAAVALPSAASQTPQFVAATTPQGSRSAPTMAIEMPVMEQRKPAVVTQATLGAELEVIAGPEMGQRFAITRSVMGLGREDQDIFLSEESISRRHANLVHREGAFLLTDQHSTHGTRVNGEILGSEPRPLKDGDQIQLGTGKTLLLFHAIQFNRQDTGQ